MTIQIETLGGWKDLPTDAEVPAGFLQGAHHEGGFMLLVTEDRSDAAWLALYQASRDDAVVGLRDALNGETHQFGVTASKDPVFRQGQPVGRSFIFRSAD